jgi:hypothetical protein
MSLGEPGREMPPAKPGESSTHSKRPRRRLRSAFVVSVWSCARALARHPLARRTGFIDTSKSDERCLCSWRPIVVGRRLSCAPPSVARRQTKRAARLSEQIAPAALPLSISRLGLSRAPPRRLASSSGESRPAALACGQPANRSPLSRERRRANDFWRDGRPAGGARRMAR